MSKQFATVEFEQAAFDRAAKAFVDRLPAEFVDPTIRKWAADVLFHVTAALNGVAGLPRRIDTGRLRGGWRMAADDAGIPSATPTGAAHGGDGSATWTGSGADRSVVVQNNVEYAAFVEDGTSRMAPGNHLKRALRVVAAEIPRDGEAEKLFAKLWGQS